MALRALLKYIGMKPRNRAQRIQDQVPVVKFEAMAKTQGKQLVQDSESSDSIAQLALHDPWERGVDRMQTQNESLTFAQLY
jgi:hypothetical protein